MAHVFISYSRADRPTIEKLAEALEAGGHSVWWDRHIRGGAAFAKDIEEQLRKADAVVVAWSSSANESDWVKDEAVFARDKGVLVPICLSEAEAPLGFRQYQTIGFDKWRGDKSAAELHALLNAISEISGGGALMPQEGEAAGVVQKLRTERRYQIGGAVAVLALLAATAFLFLVPGGQDREAANSSGARTTVVADDGAPTIAVLPFADMSPEGNQEYFADGLSEELLNVLVRVDGLKVASRTSSFALKNEVLSISDIANRLNVDHVLEGSVRKMNNRVRITAQLIDASTDKHLWSETYDRHLSDIFRIQDEIATAVVDALRSELGIAEDAPIEIKPATENLNAYDAYLKARDLYLARGKANVSESMRLFEYAVEIDPNFARGWEGLAGVYAIATSWGILDRDYSAMALVAAKRALEIDPELPGPYAVIGLTYRTHYPTPWGESIDNLQKAVERDPKATDPVLWLGMDFLAVGEFDQAIAAFNQCLAIDEAVKLCRKYRSLSYLIKGDTERAVADATINAEAGYYSDFDAYLPYFLGKGERLLAFTISRTVNWWANFPHRDLIAAIEAPNNPSTERIQRFIEWGEKQNVKVRSHTNTMLTLRAYENLTVDNWNNDYEIIWLPQFAHFRASPEFKQLAADLGIVDYWRERGFPAQCRPLGETDFECA
jgi:TolB-like protein